MSGSVWESHRARVCRSELTLTLARSAQDSKTILRALVTTEPCKNSNSDCHGLKCVPPPKFLYSSPNPQYLRIQLYLARGSLKM